ncbi:DUF5990 family protein [Nocardioides lijunqiniae]|uniref:DUF5990 family protein n=1 Tax=Nocardioides lijunqiniae TaxID=2760832 RepID=UPI001877AB51|nr:DUF5990 family protein [Nocardioides lijunqiniae]
MRIVVEGRNLPGRSFEGRDDVHVALQVGRDPEAPVPGDAASARWEVEVRHVDGDFRGPAVHGPRGQRFLYLTWGEPGGDGAWEMFRRAKLVLSGLDGSLLEPAERPGAALRCTVELTDERGGPRCARVDPPAIAWSVTSG